MFVYVLTETTGELDPKTTVAGVFSTADKAKIEAFDAGLRGRLELSQMEVDAIIEG